MAVALDAEQAVAFHARHGLADRRPALMQAFGDTSAQRDDPLFFQLVDGPEVHLGGVDQVGHCLIVTHRHEFHLLDVFRSHGQLTFLHRRDGGSGIVSVMKSSGCSSDSSQQLGASGVSAGTGVSYGGVVVKIPARYNGPDTSGNGGWVSGLVARQLNSGGPATVMLKLPPPL